MAKPSDNSNNTPSKPSSPLTGKGVVIDLGTGDGHFVYQSARQNPKKFYIGIDANAQPLEKISEKIHRKPAKGGLPNVLFVQASVESLPPELDGVADEVHIHFPWGSLLRAVATGDADILRNLRRICVPGGLLEIVIGFDPVRDQTELAELGIASLTPTFLQKNLSPHYLASGFDVLDCGVLEPAKWPHINTSWAKRLKGGTGRSLIYLIARAIGTP